MTEVNTIDIFNEIYPLLFDKSSSTVRDIEFIKKLSKIAPDNNYYQNSIKFSAYLHGGINAYLNIEFNKSFIRAEYSGIFCTKYPHNFELFAESYQNLIALIEDIAKTSIGEFTCDIIDYFDEKEIISIKEEFGFTAEDKIIKALSAQIVKEMDDAIIKGLMNYAYQY